MNDQPDLSTLPQRMRYAADVIDEANARFGRQDSWFAGDMRGTAKLWEDREAAERDAQVEELARELSAAFACDPEITRKSSRIAAELLVQRGWRRGDPA